MGNQSKKHATVTDNSVFDFDAVFDPDNYLYFYERIIGKERTAREVDFLVKRLGLSSPMKILDLACGHGRHANRLAELGHFIVGVDINRGFLKIAKGDASERRLNVKYVLGDMRAIPCNSGFDRVLFLATAMGYFNDADNLTVLKNIATVLKPQGLFCVDTWNRDLLLRNFHPYTVVEKEGNFMIDRRSFDSKTGRLRIDRIYLREGKRTDAPFPVRLYNFTEMRDLLKTAGLCIHAAYGDWDGRPFTTRSSLMIIVAKRGE
ncbi:MAG TPA: class I SAM-dependent methyltransferase [Candidatus Latescibacteria bacterium]|nr:class I SAM-dependent methyltransferase [Candidatus Latescibacterota bacterium]